jgi:invasion protein IalB
VVSKTLRGICTLGGALVLSTSQGVIAQDTNELWGTRCMAQARSAPLQCAMTHSVVMENTGRLLFRVNLTKTPDRSKSTTMEVVAPLGFYLADGLTMSVDGSRLLQLAIDRCDAQGCYGSTALQTAELSKLQAGSKLSIQFSPFKGQSTQVDVPLTGFAKAYGAIR